MVLEIVIVLRVEILLVVIRTVEVAVEIVYDFKSCSNSR